MRTTLFQLLLVLSLCPLAALAQTSPAAQFEAGMRLFQQQQYRAALQQFKGAEAGGMRDARLDYNLGSVHYRLGEYDYSRRYFEKLTAHPTLAAMAYYSLALIEHRLGHDRAAIDLFERYIELTDEPKLKALAQKQIDTLSAQLVKPWFAYVALHYGHDSNITLLPSSSGSDESGDFWQTLALAGGELYARGRHSLHTSLLYLSRDFVDDDDFDDDSLTLDFEHHYRVDDWLLQYGLEAGQSTFGGDDYLSSTALLIKARRELGDNEQIRLDFRREDISSRASEFDSLDGSLTLFRAEYRSETGAWEFRYAYEQEFNDRQNTPDESFSPTRNKIGAKIFYALSDRTTLGAVADFRVSDYRDVPSQDREDDRLRVRLEAEHGLDSTWTLQAETTYIDNESSQSVSDYHKYEIMFSISAVF